MIYNVFMVKNELTDVGKSTYVNQVGGWWIIYKRVSRFFIKNCKKTLYVKF